MRIIDTSKLTPDYFSSETEKLWCYNGLDCCVTDEVLGQLLPQMDEVAQNTYTFSRSLIGPVLDMNMVGVKVDLDRRDQVIIDYTKDVERIEHNFDRLLEEGIGIPTINPSAPLQVANLLYDVLGLPEVTKRNTKGERVRTADEDALRKCGAYFIAEPLVLHILAIREVNKRISTLKTHVDPDGRMRTNFNIGGTSTARLSSSLGDFGEGGNMQNWEKKLRSIFIPDEGMKFGNIDLGQADARNVGAICINLFGISTYLDACESGDLHTMVAKLCWPNLPWTDNPKFNKKVVAEQKFYRQHSYRESSKKLGHATNYLVTPFTASQQTTIPQGVIRDFQEVYFTAFPEIRLYQNWCRDQLFEHGYITTPHFKRRRYFLGRRNDDSTIREAVAYSPQSMTAEEINQGMLQLWKANICQLLLQVHDSLLFQFPEDFDIIPQALDLVKVPILLDNGREFLVPPDARVGWNWADQEIDEAGKVVGNELGLRAWE